MHEYVQHGWAGRLWVAVGAKKRVQRTEKRLKDRFAEVDSYVGLATYLQVRERVSSVVPVVAAVEAIRVELQALQNIHYTDRTRVRAVAAAPVERKSLRGQLVVRGEGRCSVNASLKDNTSPRVAGGSIHMCQCGMQALLHMCVTFRVPKRLYVTMDVVFVRCGVLRGLTWQCCTRWERQGCGMWQMGKSRLQFNLALSTNASLHPHVHGVWMAGGLAYAWVQL